MPGLRNALRVAGSAAAATLIALIATLHLVDKSFADDNNPPSEPAASEPGVVPNFHPLQVLEGLTPLAECPGAIEFYQRADVQALLANGSDVLPLDRRYVRGACPSEDQLEAELGIPGEPQ